MAVNVSQAVYNQIAAHRDGAIQQRDTARAQATALNADADRFDQQAADYAALLADLTVVNSN
jgi:hypothetical protein